MKHVFAILMALISATALMAQGNIAETEQNLKMTVPGLESQNNGVPAMVAPTVPENSWQTRDAAEQAAKDLPAVKEKVGQLESDLRSNTRALMLATVDRNKPEIQRLQARIRALNSRLNKVVRSPLGGGYGQRNMWRELHNAGIRSESYLTSKFDKRYPSQNEFQSNMADFDARLSNLENKLASVKMPAQGGSSESTPKPKVAPKDAAGGVSGWQNVVEVVLGVLLVLVLGWFVWRFIKSRKKPASTSTSP